MFTKIKEFLFGKPAQVEAPYKVEAPAKTVELTSIEDGVVKIALPVQQVAVSQSDAPAELGKSADDRVEAPAPVVEAKPTAKAPAKKQPAAKAPAKPKSPPTPRTPRKPVTK
jgi:hypothetical protein